MLKTILTNPTLQSIVAGQIRHLATLGGAALVANGYSGGYTAEAIGGALVVVISMIWSAAVKMAA